MALMHRSYKFVPLLTALKPALSHLRTTVLCLFVGAALLLAGCTSMESVQSERAEEPPQIDADLESWAGSLQSFEDGQVSVGVRNDDNALYVSVETTDRVLVREIMSRGLTVWIDREGSTSEDFGIHYPPGVLTEAAPQQGVQAVDDLELLREGFEQSLGEMELRVDGEPIRYVAGTAPGIAAEVQVDEVGTFTYELQLDLEAEEASAYAVGVGPGGVVGVGLSTPEPELAARREQEGQQEPPPGDVRRNDAGGRGMGEPGVRGPSAVLNLWMEVTLAE